MSYSLSSSHYWSYLRALFGFCCDQIFGVKSQDKVGAVTLSSPSWSALFGDPALSSD